MKNLFLLLLLAIACALTAQDVAENNIGAKTYIQPPSELAVLDSLALQDAETWRVALANGHKSVVPFRDTVFAKFIVYVDLNGNVRYAEDVQVIRMGNKQQTYERPEGLGCLRILMSAYYQDDE